MLTINDSAPITFTHGKTAEGHLVIGDGSDEEPFDVGITTRKLLARMDRNPETFIFHIDATFKLPQVGYPVLVMGISDRARKFHLVAFCIISQHIESVYTTALLSLRSIYAEVTGNQLQLKYVMGDAEDGQRNALENVFRHDSDFMFLMCFFHVMKKVQERAKSLSECMDNVVLAQIYDIHFCSSFVELTQTCNFYEQQWRTRAELADFGAYFKTQWLSARCSRWQCCYTKPGFATTNNPVEQFNRVIKCDYTLRSRLKMFCFIKVLPECCTSESNETRVFHLKPEATAPLTRRAKQLAKDKLLQIGPRPVGIPNTSCVRVKSQLAPRFTFRRKSELWSIWLLQLKWVRITPEWSTSTNLPMAGLSTPLQGGVNANIGLSLATASIYSTLDLHHSV